MLATNLLHLTCAVQGLRPLIIYDHSTSRIKKDNHTLHVQRRADSNVPVLTYVQSPYVWWIYNAAFNMTTVYGIRFYHLMSKFFQNWILSPSFASSL